MMRPLVMDFKDDTSAINQPYEYMFGKAILVAPVTDPAEEKWNVYLPRSSDWFDFWTNKKYAGGQEIKADASIDKIPLFVKAGSIIPFGPKVQYATEKKWDNLEIRIYPGADGKFVLYEDENDNYNYEKGIFSTITFKWNDSKKVLTISNREGSYPGMLQTRKFQVVLVDQNHGTGNDITYKVDKLVEYNGKVKSVKF